MRNHVSESMAKLAISDRTQAAMLAVPMGLVESTILFGCHRQVLKSPKSCRAHSG